MIDLLKEIDNVLNHISSFRKILLFSDFDGTLAAIKTDPKSVRLSKKGEAILNKIIENEKIITGIVSGRKISELEAFLGSHISENVNLFGCHGSEIKFEGAEIRIAKEAEKAQKTLAPIIDFILNKYNKVSGIIFEKKENSFAVNYRNLKYSDKEKINEMKNDIIEMLSKYPVKLLNLKKVLEIVPLDVDKSLAIKATMDKYAEMLKSFSHVKICIGDDITDENLFRENIDGINIKITSISNPGTSAGYFLKNISQNYIFLNKISAIT
ncbi:MAG: trehalose-phosphatase [Actinomycetota bacterium]|nr:trehalose-phosphatase [Actinomycetota bacterium]